MEGMIQMQKGNLMEHIKSWSIKDLADSYNMAIESINDLDELMNRVKEDLKGENIYDDTNK